MFCEEILNYVPNKYRFGQWAGNPKGVKEDISRCFKGVFDPWIEHQCTRPRGYGYKGLFCKQHSKQYPENWGDNFNG